MNEKGYIRTPDINEVMQAQRVAEIEAIHSGAGVGKVERRVERLESVAVGVGPFATRTCQDAVDISDSFWRDWHDPLA